MMCDKIITAIENSERIYDYSHAMEVVRAYGPLVFLAEKGEWVSLSTISEGKAVDTRGRKAVFVRGKLNGDHAVIVVWDEHVKNVPIQECTLYQLSYLTPLKSAPALDNVVTYETTFKTVLQKMSSMTEDSSQTRRVWKFGDLCDFKQVVTPFDEVDVVGRVDAVNDDNTYVKLTDCDGNFITIYFPTGIKESGVQNLLRVGSYVGVLNLKLNRATAATDECKFEFSVRSVVINHSGSESKHMIEPLELLKLKEMDLDKFYGDQFESGHSSSTSNNRYMVLAPSVSAQGPISKESYNSYDADAPLFSTRSSNDSNISVVPCSDDDSIEVKIKRNAVGQATTSKKAKIVQTSVSAAMSSRSKSGIQVSLGKRLLDFFTSIGLPVVSAKLFATEEVNLTRRACVTYNSDNLLGIIGTSVIGGLDSGRLTRWRTYYIKMIVDLLLRLGFKSTTSMNQCTTWFWISHGPDENKRAAKLELNSSGDEWEGEISFYSQLYDCIEVKEVVKSMFLSPNVSLFCSQVDEAYNCLCKMVATEGSAVRRLNELSNMPSECPVILQCAGNALQHSLYLNGVLQTSEMVTVEDIADFDIHKELHRYDELVGATSCSPLFYCDNCIAKKTHGHIRFKMMSFGVIENNTSIKCISLDCNEHHNLHLLPYKLQ